MSLQLWGYQLSGPSGNSVSLINVFIFGTDLESDVPVLSAIKTAIEEKYLSALVAVRNVKEKRRARKSKWQCFEYYNYPERSLGTFTI